MKADTCSSVPKRARLVCWDEAIPTIGNAAGNKATNLHLLQKHGILVPRFYVVSAYALKEFLKPIASTQSTLTDLSPASWEHIIFHRPLPPRLTQALREHYRDICSQKGTMVAVRSSGSDEDMKNASHAGQFASYLGLNSFQDLERAVRSCWCSYLSERANAYRRARSIQLDFAFGVIVQVQINPEKAGVMFTHDPLSGTNRLVVEANFGTGESVVSGTITPDMYCIDRSTGSATVRIGSKKVISTLGNERLIPLSPERQKATVLSKQEITRLCALGIQIEDIFGIPQDIEWAYEGNNCWILQARPITNLS